MQLQCLSCEKFNHVNAHLVLDRYGRGPFPVGYCKKCRTSKNKSKPRGSKQFSPLNPVRIRETFFSIFLRKILNN